MMLRTVRTARRTDVGWRVRGIADANGAVCIVQFLTTNSCYRFQLELYGFLLSSKLLYAANGDPDSISWFACCYSANDDGENRKFPWQPWLLWKALRQAWRPTCASERHIMALPAPPASIPGKTATPVHGM